MKKARAFDKETGEYVGDKVASRMTPSMRHEFVYRCSEPACNCLVHWRKEVHAKENTEVRPPTFVKNPSSEHAAGCFQDYERIARENSFYTYFKDGAFHVRINFPMGASNHDVFPMRGYLTEQQIMAANDTKDIKPFSTLKDLVSFIEKNLGEIDGQDMPDLVMHYQGRTALFDNKMIGNREYEKLYALSIDQNKHQDTPVALVIVKPDHEMDRNEKGKRRFACEPQEVKLNGRKHMIKPVIVCYNNDVDIAENIKAHVKTSEIFAIVARPFSNGQKIGFKETPVYLNIRKAEQMSVVSNSYWRIPESPQLQLDLNPQLHI